MSVVVKHVIMDNKLFVQSPFHPRLAWKARTLGGQWNKEVRAWEFKVEVEEAIRELYLDTYGYWTTSKKPKLVNVEMKNDSMIVCSPNDWFLFGKSLLLKKWDAKNNELIVVPNTYVVVKGEIVISTIIDEPFVLGRSIIETYKEAMRKEVLIKLDAGSTVKALIVPWRVVNLELSLAQQLGFGNITVVDKNKNILFVSKTLNTERSNPTMDKEETRANERPNLDSTREIEW